MSKLKTLRRATIVAISTGAALMLAVPASAAPPAGEGSADGLTVKVSVGGGLITPVDVGPLAESRTTGPTANQLANAVVPGVVGAGVMTTHATHDEATGLVHADAKTADVKLSILDTLTGNILLPPQYTVGAVESSCDATQAGFTGDSKIANVKLGALPIPVAFGPNTRIGIPGVAEVIFNEQIILPDGRFSVSAIHVLVGGPLAGLVKADIWVARSICGPATPPIPLASGLGLWVGLGLVGAIAVPAGVVFVRRRRAATAAAA